MSALGIARVPGGGVPYPVFGILRTNPYIFVFFGVVLGAKRNSHPSIFIGGRLLCISPGINASGLAFYRYPLEL